MTDIEDVFKLHNWLSVLTYDAYKYADVGGQIVIEWTDAGLVLRLPGVVIDTEGVNSKFKKYAETTADPVALEEA